MKLHFHSIELHNFKGIVGDLRFAFHAECGFYFVQGINKKEPRLGANGVGKSTIFVDAPYWVLTGKTILSQRPGALVENWDNKKNVSGKLVLELDGIDYIVERGRNPSGLTLNGRTVQQADIDKLLPLSDEALRRTLLLGQRSSLFLDLRPEDKSRLFSETLDLNRWLVAADKAGDRIREQDRRATVLRRDIAELTGTINQIRDMHEQAVQQEETFATTRGEKVTALVEQAVDLAAAIVTNKDALRDARNALNSLPAANNPDSLEALRIEDRLGRRTLGEHEADLRSIRREELQTSLQIDKYKESKLCPECGQAVTEEHIGEKLVALEIKRQELAEQGDNAARDANQLSHSLANIALRISDLEKHMKQAIEIKNEIALLESGERAQQRENERLAIEIQAVKESTNPFTAICNDLEAKYDIEKAKQTEKLKEEKAIDEHIEILKFWQKGFKDIRLELIDSTLLELELATNRNALALGLDGWRIEFSTERETKGGSLSQAFTVLLYPPGQDTSVDWAAFSGGEAQRWHLAVTCGLSEVLLRRAGIEPDTEIYDEVTSYISAEGIENVLDFLRQRALDLNRKIYLIDHHVGVGDFTSTVQIVKDGSGIHIN
jgi:hypothetical protein